MKDYEDEAFDEIEKAQQRKVAHGVTDGSKVTIDRAKLEQVLKALIGIDWYVDQLETIVYSDDDNETHEHCVEVQVAITTLKEALEDV